MLACAADVPVQEVYSFECQTLQYHGSSKKLLKWSVGGGGGVSLAQLEVKFRLTRLKFRVIVFSFLE